MNVLLTIAVLLADPVPVWSWHDKVAWGLNIGLVVSGTVGIIIAVYTLKAIRRQVEIANKTLIAQFRPCLHIRKMKIIETDSSLSLDVTLVNRGDMTGRVINTSIKTSWYWKTQGDETEISQTTFENFELFGGQSLPLIVNLKESWVMYRRAVLEAEERGDRAMMNLKCVGVIAYLDDNETKREIGFSRVMNHATGRFVASVDHEEEYEN